jgi:cytochrome c553
MIGKAMLIALGGLLFMTGPANAGDVGAGKAKAGSCAACHGDDGKGDKDTPALAGMSEADFIKAMKEYQTGVRTKSKKMSKIANALSETDLANLAAYYATLK